MGPTGWSRYTREHLNPLPATGCPPSQRCSCRPPGPPRSLSAWTLKGISLLTPSFSAFLLGSPDAPGVSAHSPWAGGPPPHPPPTAPSPVSLVSPGLSFPPAPPPRPSHLDQVRAISWTGELRHRRRQLRSDPGTSESNSYTTHPPTPHPPFLLPTAKRSDKNGESDCLWEGGKEGEGEG